MPEEKILSEREKDVLRLVALGLTNREIAQKLFISPNTVKVHLSNIFEKIGAASRTEATVYAIEHRIVDVPGVQTSPQEDQKNIIQFLLQFRWIWAALLLLIGTAFISLLFNVLIPSRIENPLTMSDMTERWKEFDALPEARAGLAAVLYDGDIFAIGGQGAEGVSGEVFQYLQAEEKWEALEDKPTPVMDIEAILIGEKIYIAGGKDHNQMPTTALEVFDPRHNTWEMGQNLPQPLSNYAAIEYQGELFLFGGWDGERILKTVWIYNPDTEIWRAGSPMGSGRMDANVVEVNGKLYVFGGEDEQQQVVSIEIYTPSRDVSGEIAWFTEGSLPEDIELLGVAELADFVFAIGQVDADTFTIMNYDVNGNTWQELFTGETHELYEDMGLCTTGGDIIFLGGRDSRKEIQNAHWHYTAVYTISIPIINQ